MKNFYTISILILVVFFLMIKVTNAQAPTLQTVTDNGRTTNHWIQITDQTGVLTTGKGLELFANSSTGDGYVQAYDRVNSASKNLRIQTLGGNTIFNETGGNVGIGTTVPSTLLSVYKSSSSSQFGIYPAIDIYNPLVSATNPAYSSLIIRNGTLTANGVTGGIGSLQAYNLNNSGQYLWLRNFSSTYPLYIGYNQSDLNIINGNIGINTTDTKGYKLGVNGSAIFTSAVVKLYANWPDYVFEKDYKLIPLDSLDSYIKLNKHLPEMPSTEQMQKKDGIDLGEMNTKLLQKVEELILYVIQLQKENNEIKEELKKLADPNK